jgi:hypothetical protein
MNTFHAEIDAPLEAVWSLVGSFGDLKRWHPAVIHCETRGSGIGAMRRVQFADSWVDERLDALDIASHTLTYSVVGGSRPELTGLTGTICLSPLDGDRTLVEWTSGGPNPALTDMADRMGAYYSARMDHLRAALGRSF